MGCLKFNLWAACAVAAAAVAVPKVPDAHVGVPPGVRRRLSSWAERNPAKDCCRHMTVRFGFIGEKSEPYYRKGRTGAYEGLYPDLLALLANEMGFEVEIVESLCRSFEAPALASHRGSFFEGTPTRRRTRPRSSTTRSTSSSSSTASTTGSTTRGRCSRRTSRRSSKRSPRRRASGRSSSRSTGGSGP